KPPNRNKRQKNHICTISTTSAHFPKTSSAGFPSFVIYDQSLDCRLPLGRRLMGNSKCTRTADRRQSLPGRVDVDKVEPRRFRRTGLARRDRQSTRRQHPHPTHPTHHT